MPILSPTIAASLPAWRPPAMLRRVAAPLALLALWQVAASLGFTSPQNMPAPSLILVSLWKLIVTGQLGPNLLVSLIRVAVGLAAGLTVGTVLGLAAGLSRMGEDFIDPTVQMARTLPHLALLPLMILWFGIGEMPKIVIIALGASFPIYLNLFAAIRGADRKLLEAAGMLGLSSREVIWHVVLPAALPGFLVGLRQALGIAWISLVVAEQINATSGIGYLVMNAQEFLQTDVIFDGLLVYAVLGLATDRLVRSLERRLLAWRPVLLGN
jgi:sulfonate transport system permease protein